MNEKIKKYLSVFQKDTVTDEEIELAEKKSGNLFGKARDFLLLLDIAKDGVKGKFKIPLKELLILIGCIIYVVSPADALPDFIVGLGFTDDIAVVAFTLKALSSIIKRYKKEKCIS